jgi:phage-related protein
VSEVVGEGVVRIRTDETGVDVDGAGKRAGAGFSKGFGVSLKGLTGIIGGALAAAGTVDFLKGAIGDAREAQKVTAATASIIKATGGAAKLSAGQIGDLSSALAAKTGVDDGQIQAGANLLLTFKNVKKEGEGLNDVFGRATKAGLDLAAAGFGSVEGNALQLGKALNDPLKGISALSRSGVTFTEGQKEQIKGFVEANDLLSAQKIILGEVEAQVGGTAEATATSGEKAAYAFGELKESIGTALLPVLDSLFDLVTSKIAPAIADVLAGTSALSPVFRAVGSAISGAFSGAGESGGPLDTIRSAIASLQPVLVGLFQQALPVVQQALTAIGSAVQQVLPVMADTFQNQVLPAVTALGSYLVENVVPIFVQVAGIIATQVVPTIVSLATFIYGTLYPAVIQIVTAVAERLKPVFDTLVATFRDQVLPTVQQVIEQIRTQLIPALQPLIEKVVAVAGFLLKLAATILGFVLPPLIRLAGFILANVIPAIVSIITWVAKFVNGLLNLVGAIGSGIAAFARFYANIVSGVTSAVAQVVSAIAGLPGKVLGFVGNLVSAGKDLIGGLLRGMGEAAHGVGGFIAGIASSVGSAIADAARAAINSVIDAANAAIPNSISVPGPVPDINLPDNPIPRLQGGTRSAAGGWYTVGEVGPERVYLPEGARVLTAAQTRQADAGGIDYAALAAALAEVLAPLLAGQRPVQFMLPTGDPEAAAMAALNRLATV